MRATMVAAMLSEAQNIVEGGMIEPGSEAGKRLGFTQDKFDGYLWDKGDSIYISLIISHQPGRGNVRRLITAISDAGYIVKVPVPFARMQNICARMGFYLTTEPECEEVWVLPAKEGTPAGRAALDDGE